MFSLRKDYQTENVPPETFLDMSLKKGTQLTVMKIYLLYPGIFTIVGT
jgi:hypothetical protein